MTSTVYRDPHGTSTVKFGTAVYRGYREYRPSLLWTRWSMTIINSWLGPWFAPILFFYDKRNWLLFRNTEVDVSINSKCWYLFFQLFINNVYNSCFPYGRRSPELRTQKTVGSWVSKKEGNFTQLATEPLQQSSTRLLILVESVIDGSVLGSR